MMLTNIVLSFYQSIFMIDFLEMAGVGFILNFWNIIVLMASRSRFKVWKYWFNISLNNFILHVQLSIFEDQETKKTTYFRVIHQMI